MKIEGHKSNGEQYMFEVIHNKNETAKETLLHKMDKGKSFLKCETLFKKLEAQYLIYIYILMAPIQIPI